MEASRGWSAGPAEARSCAGLFHRHSKDSNGNNKLESLQFEPTHHTSLYTFSRSRSHSYQHF
ncbi:hypothetical protein E2C01_021408 [Portunus trituberculatus]|uniref:Uncharacterized protein n=1 Tax=Portunus trituberculatus TaxID=210409 RepID=A0A5B7E2G0_PORTR|nr:hypothetical protein [Portunus trituberculatus]